MSNSETKTCQNCKSQFTIEPEDFKFYEKISVPPPTFCPACRFQRRLMFRNERTLYKRKCDLCGKDMITIFAPDKPYKVYCQPCWWSDKWDPLAYGQDYDPKHNFFEQFREIQLKAPYPALINTYATLVNSDYINHAGDMKNCYLVFNADFCENVLYSTMVTNDKDAMDLQMVGESELCYEVINGHKLYRVFFSEDITDCHDVYFSKDLVGCHHCFGCVDLRNKSYHILNKPYTKEEYEKKIKEFGLDSFANLLKHKKEARDFWLTYPHKFMRGRLNVNSSGDYVYECKNAHHMYQSRYVEDGKFSQWMTLAPAKDIYDLTEWGQGVQRIYDSITVGQEVDTAKFCFGIWSSCIAGEYSMFAISSANIFGCVSIRKKQYCILNTQYTKEEYEKLRARIIENMKKNPYKDSTGRIFAYGEFFPYDLSLFDYNESSAEQYFPLSEKAVLEKGWRWREIAPSEHKVTLAAENIPDTIGDISDSIVHEVLECVSCKRAFRVIRPEFELLKNFKLPIPRTCPNCRHMERLRRLNPPYLWERKCMCGGEKSSQGNYRNFMSHFHGDVHCPNEFETSYAPDRPEIVYCEQCYNAEVV